jgi:hypothetical protein
MIELITASVFVFSSLYGMPTSTMTAPVPVVSTTTASGVSVKADEQATTTIIAGVLSVSQKELENKAETYFKDEPILVAIAGCESSFRQYDADGNLLRGLVNKGDIGIMQINEYYHADKAKTLGFDLTTIDGNMAYAKYLYEQEGTKPWISSSKCWSQGGNNEEGQAVAMK